MLVRRIRCIVAACAVVAFVGVAPAIAPARALEAPHLLSYIVRLTDQVANPGDVAAHQAADLGGQITHIYTSALKGYSALLPTAAVAKLLGDHRVVAVDPDTIMRVDSTETNAPWGLDRIDQRARPTDGLYKYTATGTGVKAYIIDTGITFTHSDFGGRAVFGTDKVSPTCGIFGGNCTGGSTNGVDCNGHGTHVAGTVGGATYGVAKSVTLVAVRVLDCNGSAPTSDVIAGIDWATADHLPGQPAVANMSLGGSKNAALDAAVTNAINDGIAFAVAAGNGNFLGFATDACNSSPARVPAAMTIGATDNTDAKASFSNFGNCVDWFAPGVNITSDWMGSNTATNTISGTSMATPHTTGVAALYVQLHPFATPADVTTALAALTTKGVVTASKTAANNLLFTNL